MVIVPKYNLNSNIYKANYNKLSALLDLIKKKLINGKIDTKNQKQIALDYHKKKMNISNNLKTIELMSNNSILLYHLRIQSYKC